MCIEMNKLEMYGDSVFLNVDNDVGGHMFIMLIYDVLEGVNAGVTFRRHELEEFKTFIERLLHENI